jgi:hypothetical protein
MNAVFALTRQRFRVPHSSGWGVQPEGARRGRGVLTDNPVSRELGPRC